MAQNRDIHRVENENEKNFVMKLRSMLFYQLWHLENCRFQTSAVVLVKLFVEEEIIFGITKLFSE